MRTLKLTLLVSSIAIVLTGCGSSGGGSNDNPATKIDSTVTTNTGTTSSTTPTTPTTPTNQSTISTDINSFYTQGTDIKTSKTPDAKNILVVDGTEMQLVPGLNNSGGGIISSGTGFISINGSHISNIANAPIMYGLREYGDDYIAFAQGDKLATNMPTSGSAQYIGKSIVNNQGSQDVTKGSANLDVDFAAKTLTGTLSFDTASAVHLNATLKGNTFQGSKDNVQTQGAFYGDNADYLTGVFVGTQNNSTIKGAYGANR